MYICIYDKRICGDFFVYRSDKQVEAYVYKTTPAPLFFLHSNQ